METHPIFKNILVLIITVVLAGLGVWWYQMNNSSTVNSRLLSPEEVARIQAELAATTTPLTTEEVVRIRGELNQ